MHSAFLQSVKLRGRQAHNRLVGGLSPPAPPRSLAQTEISPFIANSAELAGFRVRASSLPRAIPNLSRLSGAFVSAGKIPFPGNGDWGSQRRGSKSEINEQEGQIVEGIDRAQATLFPDLIGLATLLYL